ncbi:permease (plasmid) [Gemmatirosa kalamazoonensis]|uniref:Permease n=1 Tax=Gemmatirosa kalamazoonensis TaxID=861299 RepID=W0RNU3_9BACT|nr:ADOP family duplicated permease [Gemmatirosa kalamazoonensis]AHG92669.1 permease [Gemmatirosa kalamazoonensis]
MARERVPAALERLVTMIVRASAYGDAIVGDLREGFARRAATSPADARRWYRRQALSIAWRYLPTAFRHRVDRGDPRMSTVVSDLRDAARALRRRPGLTSLLVASLALGIAANGAIFGVVRGVLLRPLAFPDADGVVTLWSTNAARGTSRDGVSRQDAADWATATHTLAAIGTYTSVESNVVAGGTGERVQRARVALASPDVFRVLRVPALLGRTLAADDETRHPDVAVVSYAFWRGALGGDPAAVGRAITVDGKPLTVVGVMPRAFDFPDAATALWKPFGAPPDATGPRQARWVSAVGRLRAGVPIDAAASELAAVASRLARAYPASNRDVGVRVEPRLRAETGDVRPLLLVAWAMVGLVLLIVTVNSGNLLLARAAEREGEVAVRAALGAGRGRLVRACLAECVVLAAAAGALGTALAALSLALLRRLDGVSALDVPRLGELTLDPWVLAYTGVLSLAAALAFGVAPALGAARTRPAGALRRGGRGTTSSGRHERLRSSLVVAQVAVAAIVLVVAGLLLRSFARLSRVEPGIALDGRVTFRVAPDWGTYPERARAQALYDQLLARLAETRGTIAVAAVNRLPLTGAWWTTDYEPEGRPSEPGAAPTASYRVVTPGYFATMGIPLLQGRGIEAVDRAGADPTVVVSRSFAERAWPGPRAIERAIGRRVTLDPDAPERHWLRVVGVVGDVHTSGLADAPEPLAYVSFGQATFGHFGDWGMDVVVRVRDGAGARETSAVLAAARRALHAIAPSIPAFDGRPLGDLVARDLARRRVLVRVLGAFAATAYLIAALGLYGVVAYGVARRRAELGLRLALGAERGRVWAAVVRRSVGLAAAGAALGLAIAAVGGRAVAGLLYDVGRLDPATFAAVGAALLVLAGAAAWVPAFRASRVSPLEALRGD